MKTFLFPLLLVAAAGAVQAQVVFTDINPDAAVTTWDAYDVHFIDQSQAKALTIWYHPFTTNNVEVRSQQTVQVLMDAAGRYPARLSAGNTISSVSPWKTPNYDTLNSGGANGNWLGGGEGFIGVRVQHNGQWHYGWVRMEVDASPGGFLVKDFAYNSTAEAAINAGQDASLRIEEGEKVPARIMVGGGAIRISQTTATQAVLTNLSGRVLASVPVSGGSALLEAGHLPAGLYFCRLQQGRQTGVYRLVLP